MPGQSPYDPNVIQGLDDPRLLDALEANTSAAFADCADNSHGEVVSTPRVIRYLSEIPMSVFNGVGVARLEPEDADAEIEAAIQPFVERKLPMNWWVGATSRPADLGARLMAHGLAYEGETPGMAIDLRAMSTASAPLPSLEVVPASTRETLDEWVTALEGAYEIPDAFHSALVDMGMRQCLRPDPRWAYFIGRLDGRPVSTSAVFLNDGVAGVYCVSTLADARRRGIGAEVTRAALLHGRAQGFRVGILQSSQMGLRVYEQLGFRTLVNFTIYALPDADS